MIIDSDQKVIWFFFFLAIVRNVSAALSCWLFLSGNLLRSYPEHDFTGNLGNEITFWGYSVLCNYMV